MPPDQPRHNIRPPQPPERLGRSGNRQHFKSCDVRTHTRKSPRHVQTPDTLGPVRACSENMWNKLNRCSSGMVNHQIAIPITNYRYAGICRRRTHIDGPKVEALAVQMHRSTGQQRRRTRTDIGPSTFRRHLWLWRRPILATRTAAAATRNLLLDVRRSAFRPTHSIRRESGPGSSSTNSSLVGNEAIPKAPRKPLPTRGTVRI